MRFITLLALLVCLGCKADAPAASPDDWPNYRGPTRDNAIRTDGLDLSMQDAEQRVVWRQQIGLGYTVATVADGRAYTAGWNEGATTLRAFVPETGTPIWDFDYAIDQYDQVGTWPKSNEGGPVVTPAVADGRLFHTTRDGRIFCLNAEKGTLIWQGSFEEMFGVPQPRWGFSASPLIIDGIVYLDVGKIVALKADTGEVLWQTKDFTQSYSTPAPFTFNGKHYLAAFPLDGLVVVERDTGNVAATFPWQSNQPCHTTTPIVFDTDKIFISSGFNTGAAVLRFTGDKLEKVWEAKTMRNTMATSLYHQGYIYGFDQKVLACIDAMTGEQKWSQRGLGQGTLIKAGDKMLIMSEGGELMTAPLSPEGFEPGPKVRLIFDTRVWSCPTIANGYLYARGARGDLVCMDLRAQRDTPKPD